MKYALVEQSGRVAQVQAQQFPVAPPLQWVQCADSVTPEWTYNGTSFVPPAPPQVVIPSIVSMRQARLALLHAGLLATVDAAIAAGGQADQITWEYATEVNRNSALVSNMAAALNLTSQQLDDLFTLAASL